MIKQGISIQRLNAIVVAAIVVMSALVILSNGTLKDQYRELVAAEEAYSESVNNANMLQAGSDNLTRQVRRFAETGNLDCMAAYFAEVDSGRREQAVAGFSDTGEEMTLLDQAKVESDWLMLVEYHAMKLVVTAYDMDAEIIPKAVLDYPLSAEEIALSTEDKHDLARNLVFGEDYQMMKDSIDENVQLFAEQVLERHRAASAYYTQGVSRHMTIQLSLLLLLILTVLAMGLVLYIQMISVLKAHVTAILNDEPLEARGVHELRYMALIYNRLWESNRATERILEKRADIDPLTEVANRGAFERLVKQAIINDGAGALMLLDMDGFKDVNDKYGHDIGDRVLKKLAALLTESFRNSDLVGRMGGDEFGVCLSNLSPENVSYIYSRMNHVNEALLHPDDGLPSVSVSAGIAFIAEGDSFDSLYKSADNALYRAKDSGRCCCCVNEI